MLYTMDSLWKAATGEIAFKAEYEPNTFNVKKIEADWTGNNLLVFSKAFLRDADSRWVTQVGKIVQVCQYTMVIIDENKEEGLLLVCMIEFH